MEEDEYIQLQTLLAKLRVNLLKEIAHPNLAQKYRDQDVKMIRSIDYLRKNTTVIVKGDEI